MRRLFISFALAGAVMAQTVSVTVPYISATQAVLHVIASGVSQPYSCTYAVCQGTGCSLSSPIPDLNSTLFSGSPNTDSKTVKGEALVPPVTAADHWFVVGSRGNLGVDLTTSTAIPWQVRALQANTVYNYGVTCGTASQVTGTFTTTNISLAESYAEPPPIDSRAFHNLAQPSIDWTPGSGQDQTFPDPLTGGQLKRITGPLNRIQEQATQAVFSYAEDLSGGGWTSVQNAKTNQVSTTLASTTTANAKLFLAWDNISASAAPIYAIQPAPVDLRIRFYGYGLGTGGTGSPTMMACIPYDGQNCNSAAISYTLPSGSSSSAAAQVLVPSSGYPTPMFAEWQPFALPPNGVMMANGASANNEIVNVSGTTVTLASGAVVFARDWPVGARVQITGGTGGTCTGGVGRIAVSPVVSPAANFAGIWSSTTSYGGEAQVVYGATAYTITSISNATPPVVTTSAANGFVNGGQVTITGNSVYNGNFNITTITATTFSLNGVNAGGAGSGGQTMQYGTLYTSLVSTLNNTPSPAGTAYWVPTDSLTLSASCGNITGATLNYLGAGILTWMASGQSASLSATYDALTSAQDGNNSSNGELNVCSFNNITDINTTRTGAASATQTGELCLFSGAEQLFIPTTGETRLLSSYFNNNQMSGCPGGPDCYYGYLSPISSAWDTTNPKNTAIGGSNSHAFTATLNESSTYTEFIPTGYPPIETVMQYYDLTYNTSTIGSQLLASTNSAFAAAKAAYATGTFGTFSLTASTDGYLYYDSAFSAGGGDAQPLIICVANSSNTLIQAYTTWNQYPLRWGGAHFSPEPIENYFYIGVNQMLSFNGALGGPWPLTFIGAWHDGAGQSGSGASPGTGLHAPAFSITGFTNAASSPVATVTGISLDPYFNNNFGYTALDGPIVTISGCTNAGGTGWSGANGTYVANVPSTGTSDQNDFTIPALNTSAFGTYNNSCTVATGQSLINSNVSNVTNASPPVVTTSTTVGTRPVLNGFLDGDSIEFSGQLGTQYFAHVLTSSTFAVYTTLPTSLSNWASATPAVYASIPHGGAVHFIEACPTGLPSIVTTGLAPFDSGATGLRCVTLRVASQPCDRWTTTGSPENVNFPPATGCAANTGLLQNVAVGDCVADIARNPGDEKLCVVKIASVASPPGALDLTFIRYYGNEFSGYSSPGNTSGGSHDTGWTGFMVTGPGSAGWGGWGGFVNDLDATNTAVPFNGQLDGCHSDFGFGYPIGLFSYSGGGTPGSCFNAITNLPLLSILSTPITSTFNNFPTFASNSLSQSQPIESYPAKRNYNPSSATESVWKTDFHAYNTASGYVPGAGAILANVAAPVLVAGYTNVYRMTLAAGGVDIKRTPLYAWSGNTVFANVSGAGFTYPTPTATNYTFCEAYYANECVAGSSPGSIYASFSGFPVFQWVWNNGFDTSSPGVMALGSTGGWATQEQISPIDTTATYMRRLTMGLTGPGMHFDYQTQLTEPNGQWTFFDVPFIDGLRMEYFGAKLPPWPANQVNPAIRNNFIGVPISVSGLTGANQADAEFGYAEDGPPSSYNCAYRNEACITDIPTAHGTDPYAFIGEPVSGYTSCPSSTGCTITVPAIPSRVVYYRVRYLNSGTVVGYGPMQVTMAAPQFTAGTGSGVNLYQGVKINATVIH